MLDQRSDIPPSFEQKAYLVCKHAYELTHWNSASVVHFSLVGPVFVQHTGVAPTRTNRLLVCFTTDAKIPLTRSLHCSNRTGVEGHNARLGSGIFRF